MSGRVAAAAILALCWSAPVQAQDQSLRLRVGAGTTVTLTENASTGYRWSLDAAASRNLAIVAVADAGYTQSAAGRPLAGAPGQRRFRVTARAPGSAIVAFAYARAWERGEPARRHVVGVEIAP